MLRDMILWGLGLGLEGVDHHHHHGEEDQEEVVMMVVAPFPALVGLWVPAFMEDQEEVAALGIPPVEVHAIPVKFHHLLLGVTVPILARNLTESTIHPSPQNPHPK
ncbi:hypothetical protein PoHVEF18_005403 [Penicillium ochrochloron]